MLKIQDRVKFSKKDGTVLFGRIKKIETDFKTHQEFVTVALDVAVVLEGYYGNSIFLTEAVVEVTKVQRI